MQSLRGRFRDILNSVLSSVNIETESPTLANMSGIRNFVRQSMAAQFVTLTLEPEWRGGGTHADLHWQLEGIDSSARLPFQFEEQADGSLDLLLENWPAELEPLVLLTGNCNFTKFPEHQQEFSAGSSILPPKSGISGRFAASSELLTLRADDGDRWDQDEEDPQPLLWNDDGTLNVCMRAPDVSEPFLAVVEKSWKLESGHTIKVPTTILLTQDIAPGFWSSSLTLDRPEVTTDGKVMLKLRPLRETDLKTLRPDWSPRWPSTVQEFLVEQEFDTRPVVDVDGIDSSKPKKRLRGVDRAVVSNKSTHLHLLANPAGGKTSASHSTGCTFQKDKVEAELKGLRANWDDLRFARLWVRIFPRLSRLRVFGKIDDHQIEDLLVDAYIALREKLKTTADDANLVSYVFTAAVNKARDYLGSSEKRRNRGVGCTGDDNADETARIPDEVAGTLSDTLPETIGRFYFSQLAHLTDAERHIWQSVHEANLTIAEITKLMRLPKNHESVRREKDKIEYKLKVLTGLHMLRPREEVTANDAIALASLERASDAGQESQEMISQLEYDIVFQSEIRELSPVEVKRLLNVSSETLRIKLESTLQRVHAATAALWLAYCGHISEDDQDLLGEWLFREQNIKQLCHEFSISRDKLEPVLHRLGTLLHGQILILTDKARGPLYKVGRMFVENRIIRKCSMAEMTQRLIDSKECESHRDKTGQMKPPVVLLENVPCHVADVWTAKTTIVPCEYCRLDLPELTETVPFAR